MLRLAIYGVLAHFGTVAVQQKGTIKMLEDWLLGRFNTKEPDLVAAIFDGFRKIRKERQKPAHVLQADVFDEGYFLRRNRLIGRHGRA